MIKQSLYSTLDPNIGGMDYRTIALHLTAGGMTMGHSTVRNIILRLMEKFAIAVMATYDFQGNPREVAKNPEFQHAVADLLQEALIRENN